MVTTILSKGRNCSGRARFTYWSAREDHNRHTIGICMTGNFDKYDPTPAQVNALYSLCKMFMKQFAIKKENILGHRELEGVTKAVLVIVFLW